jgi:hypothetical protein
VLPVSGVSLMVQVGEDPSPLAWSNDVAARLEGLQNGLGEGPCVDAHRTGRPVAEPDLRRPVRERWPAYSRAALDSGAASVFSFPLRIGAARLGALTVFAETPGPLSRAGRSDAQAIADMATTLILSLQAEAPQDVLSAALETPVLYSAVIHQASGMVSVQLGVNVADALARLRAHAFAADRPLADVAGDVVARRLRLDD